MEVYECRIPLYRKNENPHSAESSCHTNMSYQLFKKKNDSQITSLLIENEIKERWEINIQPHLFS